MGILRSLRIWFDGAQQNVPVPILAVAGPLLGLVYIVVLPFFGAAALILSSGHRAIQIPATMQRR